MHTGTSKQIKKQDITTFDSQLFLTDNKNSHVIRAQRLTRNHVHNNDRLDKLDPPKVLLKHLWPAGVAFDSQAPTIVFAVSYKQS